MAECIDRQAAIEALGEEPGVWCWEDSLMREQWECDKAAIESVSPADVRPVVRGEWEMDSDRPDTLICSACDHAFDVWKWDHQWMHFCPNCGADMRGTQDE